MKSVRSHVQQLAQPYYVAILSCNYDDRTVYTTSIYIYNFSDEQKLTYLLNPASVRHVRVIGFYLKRSLELRTEVLLQYK